MAFGWSAGDVIAGIQLLVLIIGALQNGAGARNDYQLLIHDLHDFKQILEVLKDLEPTEATLSHVNAIRSIALSCQVPLSKFLKRLEKSYDESLSQGSSRSRLDPRGMVRTVQFRLLMPKEISTVRTYINAKLVSVGILIGLINSDSLPRLEKVIEDGLKRLYHVNSSIETLLREELANLAWKNEAGQTKTEDGLEDIKQRVDRLMIQSEVAMQDVLAVCFGLRQSHNRLTRMSVRFIRESRESFRTVQQQQGRWRMQSDASQLWRFMQSPLSPFRALRDLVDQLCRRLDGFQVLVVQMFQQVIDADLRMHQNLVRLEANLPTLPMFFSGVVQDDIYFEDVSGRVEKLQYHTFQYWSVFSSWLQEYFTNRYGQRKVRENQFFIMRAETPNQVIQREEWGRKVHPGSKLCMSIILKWLRHESENCLNPECPGQVATTQDGLATQCETCKLISHPMPELQSPIPEIEDIDEVYRPAYQYLDDTLLSEHSANFHYRGTSEDNETSSTEASRACVSHSSSTNQIRRTRISLSDDWLRGLPGCLIERDREESKRERIEISHFRRVHTVQLDVIDLLLPMKDAAGKDRDEESRKKRSPSFNDSPALTDPFPGLRGASQDSRNNCSNLDARSCHLQKKGCGEADMVIAISHGDVFTDYDMTMQLSRSSGTGRSLNPPRVSLEAIKDNRSTGEFVNPLLDTQALEPVAEQRADLSFRSPNTSTIAEHRDSDLVESSLPSSVKRSRVKRISQTTYAGKRAKRSRLSSEQISRAKEVRNTGACWRCFFLMKKCSQGQLCKSCATRVEPSAFSLFYLPCDRSNLQDRSDLILPNGLISHLNLAAVSEFLTNNVGSFDRKSFEISVTIGFGKPISFEAIQFYPTPGSELSYSIGIEVDPESGVSRIVRQEAPNILPLLAPNAIMRSIEGWLNEVTLTRLDEWVNFVGVGHRDETSDWQRGILEAVYRFSSRRIHPLTERTKDHGLLPLEIRTLRSALELSATTFFMSHQLVIDENEVMRLNKELGFRFPPGCNLSSRLVNRILKFVMLHKVRRAAYKTFEGLNTMLRSTTNTWGSTFCVTLLILWVCAEIEISVDDLAACTNARGDFRKTRSDTARTIIAIDGELANVVIALFHAKYKTRKVDGFNPLRGEARQWHKNVEADESTRTLAEEISSVTTEHKSFLSNMPDLHNIRPDELAKFNVSRILWRFLKTFFIDPLSGQLHVKGHQLGHFAAFKDLGKEPRDPFGC